MALDQADVPVRLENHERRIAVLEEGMKSNRAWMMWLAVLAVQAVQTAIMYAAWKR
jgi:hypothetical protein